MLDDILISIIVPVYRVERYLHRCIDSIRLQTHKKLEIILVDDGSPDKCGAICDEYARRDSRIVVLHKDNGGLSDARNTGIAAAHGEYIGFVDSDDYIEPTMYEKLLGAAVYSGTKLTMCGFFCEHEDGSLDELNAVSLIPDRVMGAEELFVKLSEGNGWFFTVAWNKLYHRSLLNPDFYPKGKLHEDEFVIAPLIWNAQKVRCIPDKCYHYIYMRNGSITAKKTSYRHLDALEAFCIRCLFYHLIGKDEYMAEDRAYCFTLLEKYAIEPESSTEMRTRMHEITQLYSSIPVMRMSERLKLFLFRLNPKLEYWLVHKARELRQRPNKR